MSVLMHSRPAPTGRTRSALLRAAGLTAALAALGLLIERTYPTPDEAVTGPDFGPGLLWMAVSGLLVLVAPAVDGRRHGFVRAAQVWAAAVALASAVTVGWTAVRGEEADLAEAVGSGVSVFASLTPPFVALAVAGAAVGAAFRRRAAAPDDRDRPPTA